MTAPEVNITHIVINDHGHIFAELVEILVDSFRKLGLRTEVSANRLQADCLNVFVGHTVFLKPEQHAAVGASGARYIVFQSEALHEGSGYAAKRPAYVKFLTGARQVWDYSPTNVPVLAKWGCRDVHHVPIGYFDSHERVVAEAEKDIDVLFYGVDSPRRRHVIETLAARGVRVHAPFGLYGKARDRALARAKVVLNIHQFETRHLEELRLAYLLNNRSFVISETADRDPYGGGVVFCEYDKLVEQCEAFLRPEAEVERERIAAMGHEALQRVSTLKSIERALAKGNKGQAAGKLSVHGASGN
jgi:hypothetical protein